MTKAKRSSKVEQILARKKPRRVRVPVVLDGDAAEALADAERAVAEAERSGDEAALSDARERLGEASAAAEAATTVFVLRSIGRRRFEELLAEHPPTSRQRADFAERSASLGLNTGRLSYDPDSFPPVLIAACCEDPEMTVEEARALWDSEQFNEAELALLAAAAFTVNTSAVVAPTGRQAGRVPAAS